MADDEKYEAAEKVVREVFDDPSVSPEEVANSLRAPADLIQELLETLGE